MRVITGLYKGRLLKTVNDLSVRPATDRVKQTIFDMLSNRIDLEGARILDLFAGSGSLGIEALSRGASHATFVETYADALNFIERNVEALGCEAATEILSMDAMQFLRRSQDRFDLVFADPPYAYDETASIPSVVFQDKILKRHGYLLIEHASKLEFSSTPLYHAGPSRKFGRTVVTFFHHPREQETSS
ncbi:MAG TPA: 16S rRNA (guanine(966)-N(2))-methyltransferase RsmD [Bacteroidetes bacterium]|jgi:16S rRNA (guanine966-N2)-methyltransferase|nr:16S rRNA (guanine(966)-N(2))-methyltransferase RsmD [Bacteroidota bacterium]